MPLYQIEVFDSTGRKIGYAFHGHLTANPITYPHPSNAKRGAVSFLKRHPLYRCFVNKYRNDINNIPLACERVSV